MTRIKELETVATIADVAKRAGVSMMTVSRVINKNDHVSEKTRRRVLQAIEELSYRPNMVARGLATRRNQMIAYVMSNLANPFFAAVSMGIENVSVQRGYTVIIYDVADQRRLEDCLDMLNDRRIDGVVFHHLDITQEHVSRLHHSGIQCVTIDNERDLENITTVDSDNYRGARIATRHLIEKGHTRIGCIHGCYDAESLKKWRVIEFTESFQRRIWVDRTRGFLDEMKAAGLEPACMIEGRGTANIAFANDHQSMARIFEGDMPQALYCQNDILALSVLGECLERGLRVRDDLALVGHDGLDFGMMLYPKLTTVRQPRYEMGCPGRDQAHRLYREKAEVEHLFTHSQLHLGDTT